jgi:transposase InsO family protein
VPAIGHCSLHRFPATRKTRPQQTGGKGAFVAGLRFNNRRLLEPIGNIPPAEAEARYYAQIDDVASAA